MFTASNRQLMKNRLEKKTLKQTDFAIFSDENFNLLNYFVKIETVQTTIMSG